MKILFFKIILFLFPAVLFAQSTVSLTPPEALRLIFKDSEEVIKEDQVVTSKIQEKAKKFLGDELPKVRYTFFIGKTRDKIDGYALIDEEVGKVLPITFVTRINPDGKVARVEVMVYRESHGGEVATKRFLNQFRNKSLNDELRLHGAIVNVTGATLSSHALVKGVRRALALWQIFYGKS